MKTRTITFTDIGRAELLTGEVADPVGSQVLIRLEYSAISAGTERANLTGSTNVSIFVKYDRPQFPAVLGYSSCGIVVKAGPDVKTLAVGDRVALSWSLHSLYNLKDERDCVRLPDGVSPRAAALCHIATFPLAAIRKCRVEIGEPAIVMGQGILGQFAVMLLKAAGACPVIAADPIPEKRARALELGADYAIDPFDPGFAEEVKRLTDGGAAAAIEVTGNGKALDLVLDCMKKMGRVALLGCTRSSDFTIDYYRKVHGPGISLIGAHTLARPELESAPGLWTTRDDVKALLTLIRMGRLDADGLIEEIHTPEEAPGIYARLAEGGAFPVVLFDWKATE